MKDQPAKTEAVTSLDAGRTGPDPRRLVVPDHELLCRIGQGAYGEVWLARNVLGGYRAVKAVFRASFKTDEPYEREFRGIQRFEPISRSNEGLVDVLQVGRNDADGCFYYVMELADRAENELLMSDSAKVRNGLAGLLPTITRASGLSPHTYVPRTLREEVTRRVRLPPQECVQLGLNLSLALAHLHRHGLIHRDIKPANIIFVGGVPKLADIGLVTDLSDARSFVGTEGFIPPEGPNSPQADIYSLGKVLYEISMGKDRKRFPEPATLLGALEGSETLEELNLVILKACAANSKERYQTANELHADLAMLNSGKSVRWKRAVERQLTWAKKAIAVAGLLAALATAGYLFQRLQTREAQRNLYVANMNLAQRDFDKANAERLSQLLTETADYPGKGFEWGFWQRQLHLELKTLRGHSDHIRSVDFSPDGQRLISASADGTVRGWQLSTGNTLFTLRGHELAVSSADFSTDGQRVVTSGQDRTVRIWDASDGRQLMVLDGHTGMVFAAAFSPDGKRILTASRYRDSSAQIVILLWNAESGQRIREFGDGQGRHGVGWVEFSLDGARLAAITDGSAITLWESDSGRELAAFRTEGEVYSAALAPDGQRLVSSGAGGTTVWDTGAGVPLFNLVSGRRPGHSAVAYSPDGQRIVTAGADRWIVLWDAASGRELFRLFGHQAAVSSVRFSPDSSQVATGSEDGSIKIWHATDLPNPRTLPTRIAPISMMAISPDGARIATTTWAKAVQIWDASSGHELLSLTNLPQEITCLAFSPDGRRLATGSGWQSQAGKYPAIIWDSFSGQELQTLKGYGFVAFSPDGRRIAAATGSNSAVIADADSGQELVFLNGHSSRVQCGAFSPDGKRLATACGDPTIDGKGERTIKIWDAITGRELLTIPRSRPENDIGSLIAFSPDGKRIALAGREQTARVWDSSSGREILTLRGHGGAILSVVFSPDGTRILTTSADWTAKLWDSSTGRELLTLEGHARAVGSGVFFPDGRRLATGGFDGHVKIWESASQEQVLAWEAEGKNAGLAVGQR